MLLTVRPVHECVDNTAVSITCGAGQKRLPGGACDAQVADHRWPNRAASRRRATKSRGRGIGDVLDRDDISRIVLAIAVDELAAFGTELEDLEPEPDGEDDPAEDGEG